MLVGGGANAFVYRTEAYEEKELEPNQKYFSYLYTDRSTYLPTDRINVFGALTARREEFLIRPGGRVTLKLGDIMEVPVRLDRYGCFEASLEIDGMYGGTELTLCVGGEVIFTKYISFEEYDREKYDFNATTDRLVYHIGEEVAVNASVSTLDGSPVDGMGINGAGGQVDVTTDKNGMASGSFTADVWTYDGYYNWTPNSDYNWFQLTNRDEYLQEVSTQTVVLPSTVMLEYEIIDEGTVGFKPD